jgi:hypothetical protein
LNGARLSIIVRLGNRKQFRDGTVRTLPPFGLLLQYVLQNAMLSAASQYYMQSVPSAGRSITLQKISCLCHVIDHQSNNCCDNCVVLNQTYSSTSILFYYKHSHYNTFADLPSYRPEENKQNIPNETNKMNSFLSQSRILFAVMAAAVLALSSSFSIAPAFTTQRTSLTPLFMAEGEKSKGTVKWYALVWGFYNGFALRGCSSKGKPPFLR